MAKTGILNWQTFSDSDALVEHYDAWSENYDQNLREDFGYVMPHLTAQLLKEYTSCDAQILDVGAGTGLVGEVLTREGFRNLDALDFSAGMLKLAATKNIYSALFHERLGETLSLESNAYDAIVAVSVFGPTHAPAHAFHELVRITKPQGIILFTLGVEEWNVELEFRHVIDSLEKDNVGSIVQCTAPYAGFPESRPELHFQTRIFAIR